MPNTLHQPEEQKDNEEYFSADEMDDSALFYDVRHDEPPATNSSFSGLVSETSRIATGVASQLARLKGLSMLGNVFPYTRNLLLAASWAEPAWAFFNAVKNQLSADGTQRGEGKLAAFVSAVWDNFPVNAIATTGISLTPYLLSHEFSANVKQALLEYGGDSARLLFDFDAGQQDRPQNDTNALLCSTVAIASLLYFHFRTSRIAPRTNKGKKYASLINSLMNILSLGRGVMQTVIDRAGSAQPPAATQTTGPTRQDGYVWLAFTRSATPDELSELRRIKNQVGGIDILPASMLLKLYSGESVQGQRLNKNLPHPWGDLADTPDYITQRKNILQQLMTRHNQIEGSAWLPGVGATVTTDLAEEPEQSGHSWWKYLAGATFVSLCTFITTTLLLYRGGSASQQRETERDEEYELTTISPQESDREPASSDALTDTSAPPESTASKNHSLLRAAQIASGVVTAGLGVGTAAAAAYRPPLQQTAPATSLSLFSPEPISTPQQLTTPVALNDSIAADSIYLTDELLDEIISFVDAEYQTATPETHYRNRREAAVSKQTISRRTAFYINKIMINIRRVGSFNNDELTLITNIVKKIIPHYKGKKLALDKLIVLCIDAVNALIAASPDHLVVDKLRLINKLYYVYLQKKLPVESEEDATIKLNKALKTKWSKTPQNLTSPFTWQLFTAEKDDDINMDRIIETRTGTGDYYKTHQEFKSLNESKNNLNQSIENLNKTLSRLQRTLRSDKALLSSRVEGIRGFFLRASLASESENQRLQDKIKKLENEIQKLTQQKEEKTRKSVELEGQIQNYQKISISLINSVYENYILAKETASAYNLASYRKDHLYFSETYNAEQIKNDLTYRAGEFINNLVYQQYKIAENAKSGYSREEVKQLKTLDIVKKHIELDLQQEVLFARLAPFIIKYVNIKGKPEFHADGTYSDIIHTQNIAQGIILGENYSDNKRDNIENYHSEMLKIFGNYHYVMAEELLESFVYAFSNQQSSLQDFIIKFDIDRQIAEYEKASTDIYHKFIYPDAPPGFYSFDKMYDRLQFHSQSEFIAQFNTYIDKYAEFDAQRSVPLAMLLSQISLEDLFDPNYEKLDNSQREYYHFTYENIPGSLNLIKLYNDKKEFTGVMVVSVIGTQIFAKTHNKQEISTLPFIQDLMNAEEEFYYKKDSIVEVPDERVYPTGYTLLNLLQHNFIEENDKKNKYQQYLLALHGNNANLVPDSISYHNRNGFKEEGKNTLFETITEIVKSEFINTASAMKKTLDRSGWLHTAATWIIPFYGPIYNKITDPKYQLSAADIVGIAMDAIAIIAAFATAGLSITQNISLKIANRMAQLGAKVSRTEKALTILRELPALGIKGLAENKRLLFLATIDAITPVPYELVIKKSYRAVIRTRKLVRPPLKSPFVNLKVPHQKNGLNKAWRVSESPQNLRPANGQDYYNGVFQSKNSAGEDLFYIKDNDDLYQVRWDDYARTWRVVNPANPSRFMYAHPVKLGKNNKWALHSDLPGAGGGKIKDKNLLGLKRTEANVIKKEIKTASKDAINYLDTASDIIKQKKYENNLNEVLDIFYGHHEPVVKNQFIKKIEEIKRFNENISTTTDIKYIKDEIPQHPEAIFTTRSDAFSGELGEPVMQVSKQRLDRAKSEIGASKQEQKAFMRNSILHESYHGSSLDAPDWKYAKRKKEGMLLNPVLELAEHDYRPGGAMRSTLPRTELNKKLIAAQNKLRDNPDTFVFAVNLLVAAKKQPEKYRNFVLQFNKWKEDHKVPVVWSLFNKGS